MVAFIENNKRNPSKHDDEERGLYLNWIKHNKKLYAAGELKLDRVERFKELLALEKYASLGIATSLDNAAGFTAAVIAGVKG